MFRSGVVADVFGNGVGEPAAGGLFAGEHVGHGQTALLAPLPDVHDRPGLVLLHPLHIQGAAGVEDHGHLVEPAADRFEHVPLGLGQQIAALDGGAVLVLARRAAQYHHRRVIAPGGGADRLGGEGHLLLIPGLVGPALAHVEGVVRYPGLVLGLERGVHRHRAGELKALGYAWHVARVHKAAGAGAGLVVVELAAAEHRHFSALPKGQHRAVVAKEHAPLCRRPAGKGRVCAGVKGFHKITTFPSYLVRYIIPEMPGFGKSARKNTQNIPRGMGISVDERKFIFCP